MSQNHFSELTQIACYVKMELHMLEYFTKTGEFVKAYDVIRQLIYRLTNDIPPFDPDQGQTAWVNFMRVPWVLLDGMSFFVYLYHIVN